MASRPSSTAQSSSSGSPEGLLRPAPSGWGEERRCVCVCVLCVHVCVCCVFMCVCVCVYVCVCALALL